MQGVTKLSSWLESGLDLLLGSACRGCARPGQSICAGCEVKLWNEPHQVYRNTPSGQVWAAGVPVLAGNYYAAPISKLIVGYKDDNCWQLKKILSQVLANVVSTLQLPTINSSTGRPRISDVCLVPMPSSPIANRKRGLNHMYALVAAVAKVLRQYGIPARVSAALKVKGQGKDQASLNRQERWISAKGRLQLTGQIPASISAVIIDDVITTGASVHEAVKVLQTAKINIIGVCALAETEGYGRK